jgi:hypothetical protein
MNSPSLKMLDIGAKRALSHFTHQNKAKFTPIAVRDHVDACKWHRSCAKKLR